MASKTANAAFAAKVETIRAQLETLRRLADDNLGFSPDAVNWAAVGDAGRVEMALDDILAVFCEQAEL